LSAEAINIENHRDLLDYLVHQQLVSDDRQPVFANLFGGVSNRTVLVSFPDHDDWVIKQALEKLRVEADWFSDPTRIHREADGLRWLSRLLRPGAVPRFVFEDRQSHILIMQAIPEPHWNYKNLLLEKPPSDGHATEFAELLATLHINSSEKMEELARSFSDTTFFENLRLDPYYNYSASQVPDAAPFLVKLMNATRARKLTLVHGDFSPKNILIHRDRLVLLDHEVIHIGDPAFDIGFSMAHYLSKAHFRALLRREFERTAVLYWRTYFSQTAEQPWAFELERFCIRHTLGCLLARVAGKSLLEYLSLSQRAAQRMVVMQMIDEPPDTMVDLIEKFIIMVGAYE